MAEMKMDFLHGLQISDEDRSRLERLARKAGDAMAQYRLAIVEKMRPATIDNDQTHAEMRLALAKGALGEVVGRYGDETVSHRKEDMHDAILDYQRDRYTELRRKYKLD